MDRQTDFRPPVYLGLVDPEPLFPMSILAKATGAGRRQEGAGAQNKVDGMAGVGSVTLAGLGGQTGQSWCPCHRQRGRGTDPPTDCPPPSDHRCGIPAR